MDNKDLKLVFSTPIWTSILPNYQKINEDLYKYIKKLQKIDPKGLSKSNFMGWHSNEFKLDDNEPKLFINAIYSKINNALDDMGWDKEKNQIKITSMWSIINNKNASNGRHIHSNNYLSAAYYVKAPSKCGNIVFYDPREAKIIRKPKTSKLNQLNSEVINVEPKEGILILFPSYLHHSVDMNDSNEERIVISFNIDLN